MHRRIKNVVGVAIVNRRVKKCCQLMSLDIKIRLISSKIKKRGGIELMYGCDIGFQPKDCKTGHDFEVWTQGLLTALGFDAKLTGGNDNGVDIIATCHIDGKEYKYYIQCKLHNKVIGKAPVQEVFTGHKYFGGDGYPVVITNNRMTANAKAYATKLGVEVISEYQLNELDILVRRKQIINETHTGLMGLMVGRITKRKDLIHKAVDRYNKSVVEIEETTDIEKLRQELISSFDEANMLMQESAELQMKATAKQQQALALQKEAMLRNLNCP